MQGTQAIERIKRSRIEPTEQTIMKRVHREGKRVRQEVRSEERQRKHAAVL